MKIDRKQAEEHVNAGRPVAFLAKDQPARTLQVPEGGKRATRARMPAEEEEGDYLLLRDEKGNLTRAGMEHALNMGGSVMLDGKLIEHRDDLPTEAELAKGDERREAAVREALDAQIAQLMAQRQQLEGSSEAITAGPQSQPRASHEAAGGQPAPPPSSAGRPGPRPRPPVGREAGKLGEERKPGEKED